MLATVQSIKSYVDAFIKHHNELTRDNKSASEVKKSCAEYFRDLFLTPDFAALFPEQANQSTLYPYSACALILQAVEEHYSISSTIGLGIPPVIIFCTLEQKTQETTLKQPTGNNAELQKAYKKRLKLLCTCSNEKWSYAPQDAELSKMLLEATGLYEKAKSKGEKHKEDCKEIKTRSLTILEDPKAKTEAAYLTLSQKAILTVSILWLIALTAYGLDSETAFAHCCDVFNKHAADDTTAHFFELSENSAGESIPSLKQNLAVGTILSSPALVGIASVGATAVMRNRLRG